MPDGGAFGLATTLLYFDCFSGASGDMVLGALVDAGVPLDGLNEDLARLSLPSVRLRARPVDRSGIRATQIEVHAPEERHIHRGLSEVRAIIEGSSLSVRVQERALRVFTRLAEAEAAVHGTPVEKVHFHEVGALDAIADIVGAACAIERLGAERVLFSRLRLGGGTVKAGHGVLPVPAPATARLIAGCACEMGPVEHELLTPTGAAILTALGAQDPAPFLTVERVGYGAGGRDIPGLPNVLRVMVGTKPDAAQMDTAWLLEANVDDATPEALGYALERMLAAGALDAWIAPVLMKKGRPGFVVSAIADDTAREKVENVFFRETTTLGLRRRRVERAKLARRSVSVSTPFGEVRVKLGERSGEVLTAAPEYEDCRRLALEKSAPLRAVMDAAREAWARQQQKEAEHV